MVLKFEKAHLHSSPFDEIKCAICEEDKFTSLDHASVWCDKCNAEFTVRHTSGDPGYVVDCFTKWVYKSEAKYPELLEEQPYCVVKNGEPPRWIISSDKVMDEYKHWPLSVEKYVEIYKRTNAIKALSKKKKT